MQNKLSLPDSCAGHSLVSSGRKISEKTGNKSKIKKTNSLKEFNNSEKSRLHM